MSLREMDEHEVGDDPRLRRQRQCGKCGEGIMWCTSLVESRVNSGYAGREYVFTCDHCGHTLGDLDASRVLYQLMMLPSAGLFGGVMLWFGIPMAIDLATNGPGGNDLSAVIVVLVLFLGGGGLVTAGTFWSAWSAVSDFRARRASPFIRR